MSKNPGYTALPTAGNKKSMANLSANMFHPGADVSPRNPAALVKAALPLKERARALLENPEYLESLQQRLIDGEAGALEVWLYRYGYGDPKLDKAEEEEQKEEFERIRAEVRAVISKGGQEGKILDIAIQRSSRKLKRLPHPKDDDAGSR